MQVTRKENVELQIVLYKVFVTETLEPCHFDLLSISKMQMTLTSCCILCPKTCNIVHDIYPKKSFSETEK